MTIPNGNRREDCSHRAFFNAICPSMQSDIKDTRPVNDTRRKALLAACLAHVLHDGYTDQLYALLPVWQSEFGLSYAGSGGGPGPLLWHHGRVAGSGRQADCQARSTPGADTGDFRRGSGMSGDGPSVQISEPLHWLGPRWRRIERAASACFTPGHQRLPMSDGDHAQDDNESRHETATEVLLGKQSAPDGRSNQS